MNGMRQRGGAVPIGIAVLLLALAAVSAAAQDLPAATPPGGISATPTLVVDSTPPGAVVILRGTYEWTGLTPWRLYREVSGLYRVEVRLPGYETWTGEVVLGTGGIGQLQVTLGRKTVAKSLLRSAVVPGWGQLYRGERLKGTLFLLAGAMAAGGVVWTHEVYRDEVDDFNAAKRAYERETRWESWPARYEVVRRASEKADRAYDRRRVALAGLGGIYAVNLLDCLFFAPSGEVSSSGMTSQAETPVGGDREMIGVLADVSPAGNARVGLRLRWN
jgi:hypothetical protein